MPITINHQTNALTATGGVLYFNSTISGSGAQINDINANTLNGALSPGFTTHQIDLGGYSVSPTHIPWLNTLTASTTITATTSTTPTLFTANRRFVLVVVQGGGGGGAAGIAGEQYEKPGGLAGDFLCSLIDLYSIATTAMPKYTAVIGAGGAGGTTTNPGGSDGGMTSFRIYSPDAVSGSTPLYSYDAVGGYSSTHWGAGIYSNSTSSLGNNYIYKDGNTGTGGNGSTYFAGSGGQASLYGVGGNGGNAASTPTAGASAAANTGAGGGAGALYNTSRSNGGAGGSGFVRLYYI